MNLGAVEDGGERPPLMKASSVPDGTTAGRGVCTSTRPAQEHHRTENTQMDDGKMRLSPAEEAGNQFFFPFSSIKRRSFTGFLDKS